MKFFKKKSFWIILILVIIVVVVGFLGANKEKVPEYSSIKVESKDLLQSVSETGSVTAQADITYGWQTSGRVAETFKNVGDTVEKDELVAALDSSKERAKVSEAIAYLSAAQAQLNLKLAGPTDQQKAEALAAIEQATASLNQSKQDLERVRVTSDDSVKSAEIALSTAEKKLTNTQNSDLESIENAYADAIQTLNSTMIDAVNALVTAAGIQHSYSSILTTGSRSATIKSKKEVSAYSLVGLLNGGTARGEAIVNSSGGVRGTVSNLIATTSFFSKPEVDDTLNKALNALRQLKDLLEEMKIAVNEDNAVSSADKTSLDTALNNVDSGLTNIINAGQAIINSLLTERTNTDSNTFATDKAKLDLENSKRKRTQDIASAESAVSVAQAVVAQREGAYKVLIAPVRDVDVASLRADVARQAANLEIIKTELDKTQLKALSSGVISFLDVEVGENVSANQEVLSIISPSLNIEVDVSESDISKVSVNDPVEITLDAFGDDALFEGRVISVEPAETEISGVIYYKTKILFVGDQVSNGVTNTEISAKINNYEVRPGMTANIDILTDKRESVLVIPQRAVIEEYGRRFVRVLKNKETAEYEERDVVLGLRGDNGEVEVLSGISEGEEIITFIKEE